MSNRLLPSQCFWINVFLAFATMVLHLTSMAVDEWKVFFHTRPVNLSLLDDIVNREGILSVYRRLHVGERHRLGFFRRCVTLPAKDGEVCSRNTALTLRNHLRGSDDPQLCLTSELYERCNAGKGEWRAGECLCQYLQYASTCHRLYIAVSAFLAIPTFVLLCQILVLNIGKYLSDRRAVEANPTDANVYDSDVGKRHSLEHCHKLLKLLTSFRPFCILSVFVAASLMLILLCVQIVNRRTELGHFLSLVIDMRKARHYPAVDLNMLERAKQDLFDSVKIKLGSSFILQCLALVCSGFLLVSLVLSDVLMDEQAVDIGRIPRERPVGNFQRAIKLEDVEDLYEEAVAVPGPDGLRQSDDEQEVVPARMAAGSALQRHSRRSAVYHGSYLQKGLHYGKVSTV